MNVENISLGTTDQRAINRAVASDMNNDHLGRIADKLIPPYNAWTHEVGDVTDAGPVGGSLNPAKCACGHVIRYQFWLRRDGFKAVEIGSTCIVESIPALQAAGAEGLAANLLASKERLEKAIKQAEAKRKAIAADAAIVALAAQADAWNDQLVARIDAIQDRNGAWIEASDYNDLSRLRYAVRRLPAPKTASTTGRALGSFLKRLTEWWIAYGQGVSTPVHEALVKSCAKSLREQVARREQEESRNVADLAENRPLHKSSFETDEGYAHRCAEYRAMLEQHLASAHKELATARARLFDVAGGAA